MAVAGCINAYDCAGCYLTTLQQLQSDNIGVVINYTAPGEYGRRQLDYIKYTDKCGCTCCLTGENELRIVATQGVIKNFTLTNDDTNERVIVKWNDLFGSNRAYTMVRYKTGSYPTSISDGTLAVKETTQNQYSVSGYNVSGLTDGTTYYFTAFAVDSNNNVITSQNKTVTVDFDWTPTGNTIAYYKLETNTNDYSGNNRHLTNTGIVFNTYDGVKCAYGNGNAYAVGSSNPLTGSHAFTVSWWFKMTTITSSPQCFWWLGNPSNNNSAGAWLNIANQGGNLQIGKWAADTNSNYTPTVKRVNATYVFNGSNMKVYINKQICYDGAFSYSLSGTQMRLFENSNNVDKYTGYLGRTVIENVAWTKDQVDYFFDKTVKKYGQDFSKFQQVEYIESDGNAYINTGIRAWALNEMNMSIKDMVMGSSYMDRYSIIVWGTTISSWWHSSTYYTQNGARYRYHTGDGTKKYYDCNATQTGVLNTIKYQVSNFIVNGTTGTYQGIDSSWANADNGNICFWYCGNNSRSKYKMYNLSMKFVNSTYNMNVEHTFIPCYRKSDGVIGLYNTLDKQFYTNAGSGSFTKGPNV